MRRLWMMLIAGSLLYSVESEEESLFLRRIADFWQEGEYQIAKSQMEQFIVQYPKSSYSDALSAALGDLFLREKNFQGALNYYAKIESPEFQEKVFLNRMQCLYEMQWYATLADECEIFLQNKEDLNVTYFLAIGLYHQCINSAKDTEELRQIAQRAEPYFQKIYESPLSDEIAEGYAHLCCIQKNHEKAAQIYLDLAEKQPKQKEEMLFQVALIQSEASPDKAIETFDAIVAMNQKRAKEALYNKMVLLFEQKRFEELARPVLAEKVPSEKVGTAKLLIGRSLLQIKKYREAICELKSYIQKAPVSETLYAALLSLLDASFQCADLESINEAIASLNSHYPQDPELPKALFSRAQIFKKTNNIEAARKELENLLVQYPASSQKAQVLFELVHLDYKEKAWANCYERGKEFLKTYQDHDLTPFAWRYVVSASSELAVENLSHKKTLLEDLETFLSMNLEEKERNEWVLLLAKTHYEEKNYQKAIEILEKNPDANAQLLLAFCYRDHQEDLPLFCKTAEKALEEGANLIELGQVHTSLYNAYLEQNKTEKSAEHLLTALMEKAPVKLENLLWLADYYFEKLEQEETNYVLAARTSSVLRKCKELLDAECKAALHESYTAVVCKLAKTYSLLGKIDEEIALLESIELLEDEPKLLLAECYSKKGKIQESMKMFDAIVSSSKTLHSKAAASAALQSAQLKMAEEGYNQEEIAKQLKSLVIQKSFANEPLHLEAAIEYIELQSKGDPEKRLSLLKKTKRDFERRDDLLSQDYHYGREKFPEKEKIYQNYMHFFDAEILALEALQNPELQKQSQNLFRKILEEPLALSLKERVQKRVHDEP